MSRKSCASSYGSSVSKLLLLSSSSLLASASGTSTSAASSSSRPFGAVAAKPARGSGSFASRCEVLCSEAGRSSEGDATVGTSSGTTSSPAGRFPKTEKNTASKASTCAGSETKTARAVQYS